MKLRDIIEGIDVKELHADPEMEITGVSYDSRRTERGEVFVAVRGFSCDGHRFIGAAVENGASCIICEEPPKSDTPWVKAADSRAALALASRNFFGRPDRELTMIGVTGTNGKTTVTNLIKYVLETELGAKVGLIGTNGNMIGGEFLNAERTTPESRELQELLREMADSGCTHVVMEVSSHSLVLDRVLGIEYNIGAFTNLTQDHLDFHVTMEEYARAKAMLFPRCRSAVINEDDAWAEQMLSACPNGALTYSAKGEKAALRAENICLHPDSVEFDAVYGGSREHVRLAIPGFFSVCNALCVIGCCLELGVTLSGCARALGGAHGVKGRVETVPTDGDYTIIIDYAHTPDALENVLNAVRETSRGRVVALFGCGGDRDRKKRPIMGEIGTRLADFCIITSDNPRTENPDAIIAEILEGVHKDAQYIAVTDRERAIEYAIENHLPNDTIVLAGKGHETYQEVNHVKRHMDEREIVAAILEKRKNK